MAWLLILSHNPCSFNIYWLFCVVSVLSLVALLWLNKLMYIYTHAHRIYTHEHTQHPRDTKMMHSNTNNVTHAKRSLLHNCTLLFYCNLYIIICQWYSHFIHLFLIINLHHSQQLYKPVLLGILWLFLTLIWGVYRLQTIKPQATYGHEKMNKHKWKL